MMRRKRDAKISKTKSPIVVEPLNISAFMFKSVITLMFFTVASFLMYTFPYLMNSAQFHDFGLPKLKTFGESLELATDIKNLPATTPKVKRLEHSVLRKGYALDPKLVLEERNAAMKMYSFAYNVNGVDKRSQLSIQEFRDVYDGKWPVIITDVVPTWPAFNWTKDYFINNYGEDKVVMQAVDKDQKETLALPLELYLSHLDDSSEITWTYLQDELFLIQRPELREQVLESVYTKDDFFLLFPQEVQPWDCMLLWGTAYSRSTLHIDPYNWTGTNAVLSGKKLWKLVPPGQDHLLSIMPQGSCGFPMDCFKYNSALDAHRPKNERHQKLVDKIRFVEVEQNAGEMLFIPTGWFHQAFNPIPTLAVSGQLMNANNYKIVLEEIFKGGSIKRHSLPKNADSLNSRELVSFLASSLPADVRAKGAAITEDVINKMKFNKKPMN